MTALGWIAATEQRLFATRVGRLRPRTSHRRRCGVLLGVEGLEPIALLAMACPTISGYVFLDENPTNPALTNNGLFDPGESPIPAPRSSSSIPQTCSSPRPRPVLTAHTASAG